MLSTPSSAGGSMNPSLTKNAVPYGRSRRSPGEEQRASGLRLVAAPALASAEPNRIKDGIRYVRGLHFFDQLFADLRHVKSADRAWLVESGSNLVQ